MPKNHKLKDLVVDEVSLVDKGSNDGARVLFAKAFSKATDTAIPEEQLTLVKSVLKTLGLTDEHLSQIFKEETMPPTVEEIMKRLEAVELAKTISDEVGRISFALSKKQTPEVLKALEADINKLDDKDTRKAILKEQLVDARKVKNTQAAEDFKHQHLPVEMHPAFDSMTAGDQKGLMDKVSGNSQTDDTDSSDDEDDEDEEGDDEATKSKKASKRLMKALGIGKGVVAKGVAAVLAKNANLESKIQKLESESAIKKLMETDLAVLKGGVKLEPLAGAVMKLRTVDKEATDLMLTTIKSLAAQVKEAGLFKIAGQDGVEASASEQLQKKADELFEKSGGKITKAQAYVDAMKANTELYEKVQLEKKA